MIDLTAFNKRSAGTSSEDSQTDKSASADRIPVSGNGITGNGRRMKESE